MFRISFVLYNVIVTHVLMHCVILFSSFFHMQNTGNYLMLYTRNENVKRRNVSILPNAQINRLEDEGKPYFIEILIF